jgi:hypothetical protein
MLRKDLWDILVGVCYVQPEQGCTYTRRRKKSSHRLRVAMERFPGPSLSVVGDPWIASDGGFSGEILPGVHLYMAFRNNGSVKYRTIGRYPA